MPNLSKNIDRKLLLVLNVAALFVVQLSYQLLVPLLPFVITDYITDHLKVGIVLAMWGGSQVICNPLVGRVGDKVGKRYVLLTLLAIESAALLWLAFADNFVMLCVGTAAIGVGSTAVTVAKAMVGDMSVALEIRRNAMYLVAADNIAAVVGPLSGAILIRVMDFRYICVLLSMFTLADLVVDSVIMKDSRDPRFHNVKTHLNVPSFLKFVKKSMYRVPSMWIVFGAQVLLFVTYTCATAVLPVHGRNDGFIKRGEFAVIVALGGLGGAVFVFFYGRSILAKFGESRACSFATIVLSVLIGLLSFSNNLYVSGVLIVFALVAFALAQQAILVMVVQYGGFTDKGTIMGFFEMAAAVGRFAGPLLLFEFLEIATVIPFIFAMFMGLISAYMIIQARKRRRRDGEFIARSAFMKIRAFSSSLMLHSASRKKLQSLAELNAQSQLPLGDLEAGELGIEDEAAAGLLVDEHQPEVTDLLQDGELPPDDVLSGPAKKYSALPGQLGD